MLNKPSNTHFNHNQDNNHPLQFGVVLIFEIVIELVHEFTEQDQLLIDHLNSKYAVTLLVLVTDKKNTSLT